MKCSPFAACLALAFAGASLLVEAETEPPGKTPDRIDWTLAPSELTSAAAGRRPITLDDIVSRREPESPRLSPDGRHVAWVVRQGFRDINAYRAALYVRATSGEAPPVKLLEEDAVSGVDWTPDGSAVTFLSARSGSVQLWRVPAGGGAPEIVFSHAPGPEETVERRGYHPGDKTAVGVLAYRFSPSGKQIAFSAPGLPDLEQQRQRGRRGILYD